MRKVLVVVDMQKDFIDGALGFEGADKIIPGIISKIRDFEGSGDEIVYTLDTHFENYMETQEGKNLPVPHCIKGSDGWGLCNELKPLLEGKSASRSSHSEVSNSPNTLRRTHLRYLPSKSAALFPTSALYPML